jgi:hypothetical protein
MERRSSRDAAPGAFFCGFRKNRREIVGLQRNASQDATDVPGSKLRHYSFVHFKVVSPAPFYEFSTDAASSRAVNSEDLVRLRCDFDIHFCDKDARRYHNTAAHCRGGHAR